MVEEILQDYAAANKQFTFAALRYFNASGCATDGTLGEDHDPETHLIPVILQAIMGLRPRLIIFGTDYPTPDGTNVRDYIHVDDLADAHIAAMTRLDTASPIICNLGTGRGFSVKEINPDAERSRARRLRSSSAPAAPATPSPSTPTPAARKSLLGWDAKFKDPEAIIRSRGTGTRSTPKATTTTSNPPHARAGASRPASANGTPIAPFFFASGRT